MSPTSSIVFACGAAFALVACSGNNAPAPAAAQDADPMELDPASSADAPSDDRTGPQRAFDSALETAATALDSARDRVKRAVDAASDADTAETRSAALAELRNAREALANAVAAIRALEAPSDDDERLRAAAALLEQATEAQAQDNANLRTAERSTVWSSRALGYTDLPFPLEVFQTVRRNRRSGGTDASTLLTADSFPAVTYEDGKIVIAKGLLSSGDRLRMRGIPVSRQTPTDLAIAYSHQDRQVHETGFPTTLDEPRTVAGLKITPTGLVIDIGGKGAEGTDFRKSLTDSGGGRQPWVSSDGTSGGYDLTLTFGRPADSPEGSADYYWAAELMQSQAQLDQVKAGDPGAIWYDDDDQPLPIGVYHLRLSNFLGVDRKLEYPGRTTAYTQDDEVSYLSYAAYGFLDFIPSPPITSANNISQRSFPFHVGYDAFADKNGMKVTDVADARKIIEGKFKGRTLAVQLASSGFAAVALNGASSRRLRGGLELTATISGTHGDNMISGKITDLESWNERGFWEDFRFTDDLTLAESQIDPSGSFIGEIDDEPYGFVNGGYRGNFYGPVAELEASGIWYLQPNVNESENRTIIGSFGAKLVPAD